MVSDIEIIEEAIRLVEEGMSVTFPVRGFSMQPFIIGDKESVILQKPAQLKKGDVVLAWVNDCKYVVHRIIQIEGEHVTLMGDGNIRGTEHCKMNEVKAIATHVVDKKGRKHELYNDWRKLAARIWFWIRPTRRYLLGIYRRL